MPRCLNRGRGAFRVCLWHLSSLPINPILSMDDELPTLCSQTLGDGHLTPLRTNELHYGL